MTQAFSLEAAATGRFRFSDGLYGTGTDRADLDDNREKPRTGAEPIRGLKLRGKESGDNRNSLAPYDKPSLESLLSSREY